LKRIEESASGEAMMSERRLKIEDLFNERINNNLEG